VKNRYLENWNKIFKIKIYGSNINNYLKRIIKNGVHIIELIPISSREVHVILSGFEYKKLLKFKSIYEISIIEVMGCKRVENNIKKNMFLIIFMIFGLMSIMVLSRVIFGVEVIHQDKEIRELLKDELKRYGINVYKFKKDYDLLEKIEDSILEANKDKLEWIEISEYGTKYIVRVEERRLNVSEDKFLYQSIISKKDAVLVRVDAISGEKVKQVNEYVKKGEEVISGYITKPDNTKKAVKAMGRVYGEVWYEVDVDYPIVYQETAFTGESKIAYALYFFKYRLGLFDFDEYRSFEFKRKILFCSNLLDIKFVREEQFEVLIKDEVYTEDIARSKALNYIRDKLFSNNSDIVDIKDIKILYANSDEDSILFKLFVRVIEDIGEVLEIDNING